MKAGEVIFGRYQIKKHVGRGGMQDVFLATDRLLDVDVALKTPQPGQQSKRFAQSAILAARINHHNIAKTLDYFEENGSPFLVEEYVSGETLEERFSLFGVVDPHLGARILHHLSKGIAASHHAGVVHRDLKPSNIMAESGVNLHELKITDFGIATLTEEVLEEAWAKDGDLTRSTSGTIKGALPYMAPEMMFRAPGEHPGPPVDIWSLGALMFRLLTGEYPFGVFLEAAVNVRNKSRKEWPNFMKENPQFEPLSLEIIKIIETCLEYDPEKRPTADALVTSCDQLCYINVPRSKGTVEKFIQNGYSGFAIGPEGTAFFSMESVYGPRKPGTTKNTHLCYSIFPGSPRPRGHPIVVIG